MLNCLPTLCVLHITLVFPAHLHPAQPVPTELVESKPKRTEHEISLARVIWSDRDDY